MDFSYNGVSYVMYEKGHSIDENTSASFWDAGGYGDGVVACSVLPTVDKAVAASEVTGCPLHQVVDESIE